MIKHIVTGPYMSISTYTDTYIDTYSSSANQGGIGQVRFNPSAQNIEVWDGHSWKSIMSRSEITLDQAAIDLLDWARAERDRQRHYAELAKTNVTIADALESVKDAELRLRELAILCEESKTSEHSNS